MLYKDTPFTGYCIALASGIICSSYLHSAIFCNAALIILLVLLVTAGILHRKKISSISYGIIIHACIFTLGCSLAIINSRNPSFIPPGTREFVLITDDYPSPTSRSLKLHTSIIKSGDRKYGRRNKMVLYTDGRFISPSLPPGSIVRLLTNPLEISDFNPEDNFDYRAFMKRRGFRYYTFCYDSIAVIDEKPGIRHLGLRLRKNLLSGLEKNLDDQKSLAVVSAMCLGYRELLDDDIKDVFRKSGIMHIMAVSGLHVGIISMVILTLLKISRIRSGFVKLLISLLLIWTYALVTGLSPSVTRASIMFSFLNTGYLINRQVKPVNSVMASAFLILVIRPDMIYEASFLLSYSAVILIVVNYRKMVALLNFRGRILNYVWKMIVISLLAQAGTIPFVALFFGKIPLLSLVSNLFAIPLATIILLSGFALVLFASIPFIPLILAKILVYSVNTLSDAAAAVASLDIAVAGTGALSPARAVI
ncbi:MAG: ComEC/Rec2 family competence protein, partial [Bacteroidota bacterium]